MLNLIKGEFLKLKRSSIFKITTLGSCVTPLVLLLVILRFAMDQVNAWSLTDIFDQSLTYQCIFFGLLLNILIVAYLFNNEYKNHTIKAILTTQVTRFRYFSTKFIVFILWSLFNTLVSWTLVLIIGLSFNLTGTTANVIITSFVQHMMTDLLICCITVPAILLTLIFKNVIPSIIAGMGVFLGNMMIMGDKFSIYYPTTGILMISLDYLREPHFNIAVILAIVLSIFAVSMILSWIYFDKKDITL